MVVYDEIWVGSYVWFTISLFLPSCPWDDIFGELSLVDEMLIAGSHLSCW